MIRIIFHSIDGVGLGHLMRGINIAKELRRIIDCEIIFVTNTPFTEIIREESFKFIAGGVDPYKLYTGKISRSDYLNLNEEFLLSAVKEFHPDIVIFDLLILPRVIDYIKANHIFSVYILREINNPAYLTAFKKYLSYFDLILITGIRNFPFIDPRIKQFISQEKIFYIDNIFREPDTEKIKEIKLKYRKKFGELLVTINAGGGGGGGYLKEVRGFFNCIIDITNKIKGSIGEEDSNFQKIRWLVIKGPLFRYKITFPTDFKIYEYEKNLPELFAISDLVVSTGGYNTINEIIASKTPALVYPLPTLMDSQIARVSAYVRDGFIQPFDINNFEESVKLFKKTLDPFYLNDMKKKYANYIHNNGKKLATGIILKRFFECSKSKIKVGILRLDIDDISEFFVKEETKSFSLYKPLFFCGRFKSLNESSENYFCEDYHRVSFKNSHIPIFSKKSLQRFYEITLKQNVSLLHSQFLTDSVSYLPLIKKLKLPFAVSFRGYELSDGRAELFFSKVEPFTSQIITKSNFQKKALIKNKIKEDKIATVYGGIDIDKIPFKLRNIDKNKLRLLSAGRFVEKKGFDVTLKFFKELLKKYSHSILTLIGDGPLKPKIEEYIKALGIENHIYLQSFMSHTDFVRELFKHDIFILPSKTTSNGDVEGIPNVLKEAMASGMPVISTYHAGIPEMIEDCKTGFLVDENDFQGILEKIEGILENKEKVLKICLNARFSVEKNFDIKKTSSKLESLYSRLLMPDYVNTIFKMMEGKKPIKFRADLHLIAGCNGRCIMCDNWKNKISSDFSRNDISKLLESLKSFGVNYVRFHGQEPTLRKDLFAIMGEAKDKGFKVGLKTNALLFSTNDKIKKLCSTVDDLYLSIDSPVKEIHNLLRGRDESFSRNINLAKKIKKINPYLRVYFNAVITKLNYKNLVGLLDFAYSLKASKVSFVHLNTKNKKNIEDIKLTKQQFIEFYFDIWPQILKKSLQFKIPVSVDPYFGSLVGLPLHSQINKLKENSQEFEQEINNFSKGLYGKKFYSHNICYGVLDHVTIDWKGNVYPCCAMPRSTSLSMGNVIKDTFYNVWNSKKYARHRQEILQGKCKFKDECSRNFRQSAEINNYIKKDVNGDNHNENIITEFLNQFRYNEYMARYKLKMMVYYAFSQSQFYREKFEGKLNLGNKTSISELPIVKKSELRSVFPRKEIVPNYFNEDYGIFRTSSCGSQSFLYARSLQSTRYYRMATSFLNTGRWKINTPWLKLTALNCLETAYPLSTKSASNINDDSRKDSAIIIPPSENFIKESSKNINMIYKLIRNSKTYLIHANPTYLKLLLYRFRKEGLNLEGEYAINSTYELLLPSTEKLIKKYLNCQIYDQYGCSEIGPISFTCKKGNLHIFNDSVYVEIVPAKDMGRNDIGMVVVTDLKNRVMPFVRYFTGDFASVINDKFCDCDLKTPIMGRIVGRENEIILYKKRAIFPLELDSIFFDLDNVLMYQIFFENEQFFIMIVPEDTSKTIDVTEIIHRFKSFFEDKKCQVHIEIVEFILPNRRGKYNALVVK